MLFDNIIIVLKIMEDLCIILNEYINAVDSLEREDQNVNPNPDPLNLIRKSDAAKIPSPSGITIPPAAAKKVGLKVNDTKNLNNHTDNV